MPLPGDGLRAVNVYVIEDDDGLVLIDSGWALEGAREVMKSALAAIGYRLEDVRRFLITHLHRDHYTCAVALRREFGTRIQLGSGEKPSLDRLAQIRRRPHAHHIARLRRCGAEELIGRLPGEPVDPSIWEQPDDWLEGGTEIALGSRTVAALPTPGHTQGHLVFFDRRSGLLFAGDHVLPHITPSIGFEPEPGDAPLRDYLDSLALVRGLPDARLLPAHGWVTDSVHRRVDELLDHHAARLDAVASAVTRGEGTRGEGTAYHTARLLTWTRRERAFTDLDPHNQMLAVLETAAHLDVLVLRGRLRASEADGVTRYEPRPPDPA
ncbi:MAG: MBL fold metallo-hydrolase [Nocardiopsaceae bacterium]|nr:MBL fold metallo-hydrolase [Nocardiopsaceae bacterium]